MVFMILIFTVPDLGFPDSHAVEVQRVKNMEVCEFILPIKVDKIEEQSGSDVIIYKDCVHG